MQREHLIMPNLGLDDEPLVAGLWLVSPGSRVVTGDPLLEVVADCAVIDLPSPVCGLLTEALVSEDDPLQVGQPLAVIRPDIDESSRADG